MIVVQSEVTCSSGDEEVCYTHHRGYNPFVYYVAQDQVVFCCQLVFFDALIDRAEKHCNGRSTMSRDVKPPPGTCRVPPWVHDTRLPRAPHVRMLAEQLHGQHIVEWKTWNRAVFVVHWQTGRLTGTEVSHLCYSRIATLKV